MRRLQLFFLLLLLLSAGCGSGEGDTRSVSSSRWLDGASGGSGEVRVGLALSHLGLGDQSFNDMQYNGLIEAFRRFRIKASFRVPEHETDKELTAMFLDLIDNEKCNLVIAGEGFKMAGTVNRLARKYTNVMFILMEASGDPLPNIVSTEFAQNEGSFIVGVLASRMTRTGRVGFLGGVDIPVLRDFLSGFRAGIRHTGRNVQLVTEFVTKSPDFSGFNVPERGKKIADRMFREQKVDIIYAVAGATGNGVIQSARENKKFVIGVDSNQDYMAPGFVLTSMMKRLDQVVLQLIQMYIKKNLQGGRVYRFDYHNNGIGLTDMQYTRKIIPPAVLRELKRVEQQIADGTIKVANTLRK